MTMPTLPPELQLYIVELAAPLHDMTRRHETLKSCSLVHRSWTSTAQKLLFQHLEHSLHQTASSWPSLFFCRDDARLRDRLRQRPSSETNGFTACTIRNCANWVRTVARPVLQAAVQWVRVLSIDWIYVGSADAYLQLFPSLQELVHVYSGQRESLYLHQTFNDSTLESFSLVNVRLYPYSVVPNSTPKLLSLRRFALQESSIARGNRDLAALAPNLNVFVSHLSHPRLDTATLAGLPTTLRLAIFTTSPQDLVGINPVRLPSSLELLQVYVPVDLDRRGRIPVRDIKIIETLKADLAACRGGPNLVVKVETVPTSTKTADELFEETADRYSLLR